MQLLGLTWEKTIRQRQPHGDGHEDALCPAGRVSQAVTRTAVTQEAATFTNVCKH